MDLLAAILLLYDVGLKVDYGLLDTGYLLILIGTTPKSRHDNDFNFLEQTLANDQFWSGIVHSDGPSPR
jgi:hypothetical protein